MTNLLVFLDPKWAPTPFEPTFAQAMDRAPRTARQSMLDGAYRLAREPTTEDVSGALQTIVGHVMSDYLNAVEDMVTPYADEHASLVLQKCRDPEPGIVEWTRLMRGDVELGRVTLRWAMGEPYKIERTP